LIRLSLRRRSAAALALVLLAPSSSLLAQTDVPAAPPAAAPTAGTEFPKPDPATSPPTRPPKSRSTDFSRPPGAMTPTASTRCSAFRRPSFPESARVVVLVGEKGHKEIGRCSSSPCPTASTSSPAARSCPSAIIPTLKIAPRSSSAPTAPLKAPPARISKSSSSPTSSARIARKRSRPSQAPRRLSQRALRLRELPAGQDSLAGLPLRGLRRLRGQAGRQQGVLRLRAAVYDGQAGLTTDDAATLTLNSPSPRPDRTRTRSKPAPRRRKPRPPSKRHQAGRGSCCQPDAFAGHQRPHHPYRPDRLQHAQADDRLPRRQRRPGQVVPSSRKKAARIVDLDAGGFICASTALRNVHSQLPGLA
jgi:hypothetical protein